MTRLVGCLPLLLRIAVVAVALEVGRRLGRRQPPPAPEPDDGVQPQDVYLVSLARDDLRVGTYSRN